MNNQDQNGVGVRAADVELPPSMANVASLDTDRYEGRAAVLKLLAYARKRYARLCQLVGQHHKHSSNRLAEKAELEEVLAPFGVEADADPRKGGVDATGSEGGVA